MNEQAVRQLTRKGCIVAKEAAEDLKDNDVETIEELDSIPMYLSEAMLQNLREHHDDRIKIRFVADCPQFMATDMEVYGAFEEGDTAKIPEDNAEILINRGMAEEVAE